MADEAQGRLIRGMETVVATVSGYHGSDRFNLIKLISQSGANYVGNMSSSITHLVCWKFEGKKYDLAKKLNTLIVSPRWFEDCVKAGKRIPEDPYLFQSGQEVRPLQIDGLLVDKTILTSKRDHNILMDRASRSNETPTLIIDVDIGDACDNNWTPSFLLKENFDPHALSGSKNKSVKRARKEHQPINRNHKQPTLSAWFETEQGESSVQHFRQSSLRKRETCKTVKSNRSAETSSEGRRLVRKTAIVDVSDSDHDSFTVEVSEQHKDTAVSSDCRSGRDNRSSLLNSVNPVGATQNQGINRTRSFGQIDDCRDSRFTVSTWGMESNHTDPSNFNEGSSDYVRTDAKDGLKGEMNDTNQIEQITKISTAAELSCVICWTDFSSTRGVLPCGHRYCYSCIQNWADHMFSRRKTSTCPLCKACFKTIAKVDDAATSDQKIYSQTVPSAPSMTDIFFLPDQDSLQVEAQSSLEQTCWNCQCREIEAELISCNLCNILCIHRYCLDPPLLPWTCTPCKDSRRLYHHCR